MTPLYLVLAAIAVLPDVAWWLRVGAGSLGAIGMFEAVQFVCCVRKWRFESGSAVLPTLRNRSRRVPIEVVAAAHLVRTSYASYFTNWQAETIRDSGHLFINLFVSPKDLRTWKATADRTASSASSSLR